MAAKLRRTFEAVVESLGPGLGWTIARVPFVPAEVWPEMVRLRVKGEIASAAGEGFGFRSSLFPFAGGGKTNAWDAAGAEERGGSGGGYFVLVTKAMQREAGVGLGGMATIWLEPDMEPRPAELPDELAALLEDEPGLRGWYDELSEYTRREIGKWVLDVKSDAARMRRVEQMAERLLATMEGERELPPVVQAAFRRRPKAKAGWARMTPTQRRMELFAVNYYQTPEAREKRVDKLCAVAEKKA
jgi:uncharacterized protein YdeI (YjbR/CyaY-like superfamily)